MGNSCVNDLTDTLLEVSFIIFNFSFFLKMIDSFLYKKQKELYMRELNILLTKLGIQAMQEDIELLATFKANKNMSLNNM